MVSERIQRQIDRLLDQAEEAFSHFDWEAVRQGAEAVLRLDPNNADALTFLEASNRDLASLAGTGTSPDPAVPLPPVESGQVMPTSFANGRYQVKDFLGEGGKKRVYQAHDSVLDRDVALAVIKTEGLDPTSRVRVTREAQAMGRLGDHAHVLQIFDLGDEAGQPYMVLPLMPGGDVGTLLGRAEDHRLPLEQAIDLASQICRGLEFAHSKSIVHRDLKPGNVWLTADGTARIGDFGLAVAIDRSRLTQEGMMVGTVSYMPPEQAMGGEVTPQSDLYSLGAMLYEMVTGRPPFLGDDSVAIIGQHINTPPVAPTWHNPECPRVLEALIMRLLAKDPKERPDSATDVVTALEAIDLNVPVEGPASEMDGAHALDSLAGGVFVGRQREMGELKAALEDVLSGRGRLVTLVGEPGIGKTRTAQELATYAGLRRAHVLWGRCHEARGAPPYWPWVQAIRSYVREREPDRVRSEMGAGAADIAEIVSDVRERLPDIEPSPSLDDAEQARFRLFDSITAFLKGASRVQPLVVILDNLHWADRPSLLLLEFIAQELADSRLLVVGTYRDVDLSRQHPLAETLGELNRERLFQRIILRGLEEQDVGRFMEVTSGIKPPAGLVSAVHTQTEGNPLFVTEIVRLLVQEGELTQERSGERDSWTMRIPEGVREVIGRRLNRLSERCNQTLTMGAVIGREFEIRQLARLVDDPSADSGQRMSEDRVLDVLEEGLSARVIRELPEAVGRYEFTHALIQQTLMDELSTTRRVRLHARVIELFEELHGDDVEYYATTLAYHATEAEAMIGSEKLIRYSRLAGELALNNYAHEEALIHFERALAATEERPVDDETAAILYGLGRAQVGTLPLYRLREAVATLSRALDYYCEVGDADGAVAVAEHPFPPAAGHSMGVPRLIARALDLVPPESLEAGRLLSIYGRVLSQEEGDYEGSQQAFSRALVIAEREGDKALEMRTLVNASEVDLYQANWEGFLEKGLRAQGLVPHVEDLLAESLAHFSVGLGRLCLGDPEGAVAPLDASVSAAERLRHHFYLARSLWVRAALAYCMGELQAVRDLTDRGLAASPREPRNLLSRTIAEYEVGDFGKGEVFMERLLEVTRLTEPGPALEYTSAAIAVGLMVRITGANELYDVGHAAAETVLSSESSTPVVTALAKISLSLLAAERRDVAAAEGLYASFQPARIGLLVGCGDSRTQGLLAHTMGKLDVAAAHFEDEIASSRELRYLPQLAWTCCDYADMLLDPSASSGGAAEENRQKATALLDESLAISSDLGMRPLMERVLSRKMRLQGIDISSPQTSIDAVISAVEVERPNLQPHAAPDGTVTVMFTDIEGSTAMTERLGDVRAQDVLRTHNVIIRQQVAAHQGFEVKSHGDGFMMAFSSARRALECAIATQQTLAAHNAENPGEPIRVRMGLHTGEAIKEGEDFFGKSVILAARIASQAVGGEILVSSLLKALVESSGEFGFGDSRELELKGLAGTHQVFEVSLP